MFCSKCGKTIAADQSQCPHCSTAIGQSRFEGVPYTSAQPKFMAGSRSSNTQAPVYTRTTYTGMDPEREETGEIDARTTYRPAYEGASAPDDVRKDMRSDLEAATAEEPSKPEMPSDDQFRQRVNLLDKELQLDDVDLSQFKSRPITRQAQAGISRDVSEYISHLEATQERKASRKTSFSLRRKNTDDVEQADDIEQGDWETVADTEETKAEAAAKSADFPANDEADDNQEYFTEQEDYDYSEDGGFFSGIDLKKWSKIAIALVLVTALFVGGVYWIRYISSSSNSAPIEGVTLDFYNNGIAQIEMNASKERIDQFVKQYTEEGLLSVNTALSQDAMAIASLLPASPATNDNLFLQALTTIETNIGNAVTMDVLATTGSSETASQESAARWAIVNNSIASLKAATSAAELNGIINGQQITVSITTPTPIPTSTARAALSIGDKSDAVLDMQNRLYELGFFQEERDGAYGTKTATAIKLFQNALGLNVTGIADSETLERMYADDAPYTQLAPSLNNSSAPGATSTPAP